MENINLSGYLVSGLIGVSLGLIGGGGSIITIPMLVYLFHIAPGVATTYSLFIVGTTSLVGGIRSAVHGMTDLKSAILFAIPSTAAVYLTRHFLLPLIPVELMTIDSFVLTKNIGIMIFLAIIMIIASLRMIRDKSPQQESISRKTNLLMMSLLGLTVGVITGIVGAGGGFLIIPALIFFTGLPMKKAIGTSLLVIAMNSLIGFFGDMKLVLEVDIHFMVVLTAVAIVGVLTGAYLSKFIDGKDLKAGFGWFTLVTALFIVIKEVLV